ncbi:Colicin V production protein [Frankineae bacterium MT45]|nr:Colicin V production protein [Frankineae bacterium MT45]
MNLVDFLIVATAFAFAFGGFRNGAVVGICSLAGFVLGVAVGARIAEPVTSHFVKGSAQVPVAIVIVVLTALLIQGGVVYLGRMLRQRITWSSVQRADAVVGAIFGVVSVLVASWIIAVPLASAPYPSIVSAVRNSVIVRDVDGVMPSGARNIYSSLRTYLDRSGFPPVFGDLQATQIVDVPAPDPSLVTSAAVVRARSSVVKIYGIARSCDRQIEGSGFVYAPNRILTNAHVVAGTSEVTVQTPSGSTSARVVVYDPERDLAVLAVSGLKVTPLTFATDQAKTDASAIVLGYPEDGPFDVRAARVRERENLVGRDIYGAGRVTREIYSIRALVRSGNSGGPLISTDGRVLGVVFATALDSTDTGFVLTAAEAAPDYNAGRTATAKVSTGACTS